MKSVLAFSYDDSPMKIGMEKLVVDMGASSSSEFYVMNNTPVKVGDFCLDEVEYNGDNPSHPSTLFWQSQYKKWQLYDFLCDPQILAAHDLIETLFMRLSFHLRDKKLLEACREGEVCFGPFSFSDGSYDLSYHSICWYMESVGDDQERALEKQWCNYAMGFAEKEYLEELVKFGYGEKHVNTKQFREEIMMYAMKLRSQVNRNDMAHVFSTSIRQVWMKSDTIAKSKNKCLLDQAAPALKDGYKKKLIAILDDLAIDIPNGLCALGTIIPMQAFFLKTILLKPVRDEGLPKPAKLPRKAPPLLR
ncbi:hypothetical protein KC19_12G153600 [Ceratodon purpureus]|uniref:Uncharacterized protein n=1 Tax=Ceratodon purpureus TaxID=3225 RepID=A0A8T0G9S6_CERPU|nr:hypothetical protein KC19_12G153600 [Ceratodon purpureus]